MTRWAAWLLGCAFSEKSYSPHLKTAAVACCLPALFPSQRRRLSAVRCWIHTWPLCLCLASMIEVQALIFRNTWHFAHCLSFRFHSFTHTRFFVVYCLHHPSFDLSFLSCFCRPLVCTFLFCPRLIPTQGIQLRCRRAIRYRLRPHCLTTAREIYPLYSQSGPVSFAVSGRSIFCAMSSSRQVVLLGRDGTQRRPVTATRGDAGLEINGMYLWQDPSHPGACTNI